MRLPLAAAALAAAVPATAQPTAPPILPDAALLEVTAVGRVVRTPDVATVRAGVVTQGASAGEATGANAAAMARVLTALKAAGIAERDVQTSMLSIQPQYRYAENQPPVVTGYQATNSVSVRYREVARAGRVIDALVKAGANQIDGPALSLAEPDAALDEARADAVKRARARADLYARAAGLRVERIASITEAGENDGGTPQPPVMYRARAMVQEADTSIRPGETDVTVTLAVRFVLR